MDLQEGAVIEVVVTEVRQFGFLVEFEGGQGVIDMLNFSWHPDDVNPMLAAGAPGQRIKVKVMVFVPGHFALSIKHLHPELDPWLDPGIYSEGTRHSGLVRQIFDFGPALIVLKNGALVVVEALRPGTRLNDTVNIVVKGVHSERERIYGEQV